MTVYDSTCRASDQECSRAPESSLKVTFRVWRENECLWHQEKLCDIGPVTPLSLGDPGFKWEQCPCLAGILEADTRRGEPDAQLAAPAVGVRRKAGFPSLPECSRADRSPRPAELNAKNHRRPILGGLRLAGTSCQGVSFLSRGTCAGSWPPRRLHKEPPFPRPQAPFLPFWARDCPIWICGSSTLRMRKLQCRRQGTCPGPHGKGTAGTRGALTPSLVVAVCPLSSRASILPLCPSHSQGCTSCLCGRAGRRQEPTQNFNEDV